MEIYIIEFFIIILLIVLFNSRQFARFKKDKEKLFLLYSFIMLTIVMAIREPHLGTDSWMYGNIFNNIGQAANFSDAMKISTLSAPLYVLICRILYKISESRQSLIIVSAIIVNACFYNFIKRESKNYFMSVLLYITLAFYFQSFNGTRQYISVGLVLNAFSYWSENKRNIKGWIFFFCAILVHSIGVFGVIYIFLNFNRNKRIKNIIINSVFLCLIFILGESVLINLFIKIFPNYASYFDNSYGHISYYDNSGGNRKVLVLLMYLVYVIYAIIQLKDIKNDDKNRSFIMNQLSLMIIAIFLGLIGARSWAISRINIYFTSVSVCFIPNTFFISNRYKKLNRILIPLTVMITSVYGLYYLIEDKADIVPYLTFWQ